jgi:hypothetical protein
METLTAPGRLTRVAATLVGAGLLLAGSIWGQDDDFPFGPFRMYSTVADLNAPVADTRVEAIDTSGATVPLTEANTGIRRAEIEGQMGRFRERPGLLKVVADAYARKNPRAPAVGEVRVVIRWHQVRDGLPTGAWRDEVVTTWTP